MWSWCQIGPYWWFLNRRLYIFSGCVRLYIRNDPVLLVFSRTRHAACPVLIGNKWVSNKWTHEFGNEFVRRCDLDKNSDNDSLFWIIFCQPTHFSSRWPILNLYYWCFYLLHFLTNCPNHLLPSRVFQKRPASGLGRLSGEPWPPINILHFQCLKHDKNKSAIQPICDHGHACPSQ